jgi:hypothetical protein
MRRARNVACIGDKGHAFWFLVGESEAKKKLGRLRRRMENQIKMDPKETELEGAVRIHLVPEKDHWSIIVNMGRQNRNNTTFFSRHYLRNRSNSDAGKFSFIDVK